MKNRTLIFLTALVFAYPSNFAEVNAQTLSQIFNDPTPTSDGIFTGDSFGISVAISGNNVLVGAFGDDTNGTNVGQVYLFDAATGNLLRTFNDPTVTTEDLFGNSVAISGNNVLIAAPSDDTNGFDVGQVYLFDAVTGDLLQTFNDPTPSTNDKFGFSVTISGNNILIGAAGDSTNGASVGQAHLFDATTGNLLHTFNEPNSPSIVGGFGSGFGVSVAVSDNNVLVGAFGNDTNGTNVGQVHLFDSVTGNLLRTFNDPTVTTEDLFGSSVAISGNNVIIAAPRDDTNGTDAGQVHLFDASTGNLLQTFESPAPSDGDIFGVSIAISGNNLLIGSSLDDTNGTNVGQAYLFDTVTGNLLQTFNDPTVTAGDFFGRSVVISGSNVLVGAPGDDTNGTNVGQAYLYNIVPEPSTASLVILALTGFCRRRTPLADRN